MPSAFSASVLLVDDQPRNLIALEAALTSLECHIETARSGPLALEYVLQQDFAVIVLDIHMPGMDGFETAQLVRARERSQSTPIIFLTADDRRGVRVLEGYRLGAVDYLYKPFDPIILRSKVEVFVELFRKTAALEQRTKELTTTTLQLERRTAELEDNERHFRALIENASDVILIVAENATISYASPSIGRTLGYSCAQLHGQNLMDFLHADDVSAGRAALALLLETGNVSSPVSRRWRHADGSYRTLESTETNLLQTPGVFGLVVNARDVTERDTAQGKVQALRVSEERFRRQYKGVPLPTYSWLQVDDDFVLEDYNDAAEAVVGVGIRDWLGIRASARYADQPAIVTDLQACALDQRTICREVRYRYPDTGRERDLAVTYVFVPPKTVMIHTEDVTEVRQAEHQREAMAQSEKLRALGQMATGIAHDLNQSLMLVASYSDLARQALVQKPPDLAELEDLLATTTQAALDGGETVKRLLLFTRAAPEHDIQQVDLGSLVREAARLTAPRWRDAAQAEGRPISMHVEAEGHPFVQGSPSQLRELLTNLVFNAVDALPTGGTIGLRVVVEVGHGIVEVTDSGVGMTAEVQARVFEPFFTTKGVGGTGLGLAMVFGIVEQHGGHIVVRSAPGAGTTFRIALPLVEAPTGSEPAESDLVCMEPQRPLRVLVVDDEPMMTRAVARMLKPSGHVVSVAASGEEALDQLAEQAFDVVLSDMGMGAGMNGWELADVVRRRWPGARFLLATGWGAAIDPAEALTRGVQGVLSKPYQLTDLLNALAKTDHAA